MAPAPQNTPEAIAVPGVKPAPQVPVAYVPLEALPVQRVNSMGTDAAGTENDQAYHSMINHLFDWYGGHAPRTDIMFPAGDVEGEFSQGGGPVRSGNAFPAADPGGVTSSLAAFGTAVAKGQVLIPTGRINFAHTVLAVDSDSGGTIVLEADTWPLA